MTNPTTSMVTVSIYEDNEKLRSLLELLIDGAPGFSVAGSYPDGQTIVTQIGQDRPDVVLMDVDMPGADGIECVRRVKEVNAEVRVLMHTMFDDDERLFACLSNGADGYLLKRDSATYLLQSLKEISEGGGPMSPSIAQRVLSTFRAPPNPKREEYGLTNREREILEMLTRGYPYRRIGIECDISIETVRRHLKNIYQKLHVQCSTEAVAKAVRERLVKGE